MDFRVFFDILGNIWFHIVATAVAIFALAASCHVILYKRDSRAAISWMGMIWLVPLGGSLLYLMFGINRLQRKAVKFRGGRTRFDLSTSGVWAATDPATHDFVEEMAHLAPLGRLVEQVTGRPLTAGNRITPLVDGDEAYPAMLAAIDSAQRTVALASYIFDNDDVGRKFVESLGAAVKRGVEVRVLIDSVGSRYTFPSIARPLRNAGVTMCRFMPTLVPGRLPYANLRSHRKLLVIDGALGFTGGLNIRAGHWLAQNPSHPIHDMHYRIEGPVVSHLQEVFTIDWEFASGELLQGDAWFPEAPAAGHVLARGISTGPDYDFNKSRLTLLGALATARTSVRVVTPYFLPDASLVTALNIAALRGVEVDIVLPEANNLKLVKWACTAQLWQVLERGCHVWMSPPPFDHTKLTVIDRAWVLFGSSNWDPRSLRLNFEFDVECYDRVLASTLDEMVRRKRAVARRVTLASVDGRSLPVRLRDGLARLLTPYL